MFGENFFYILYFQQPGVADAPGGFQDGSRPTRSRSCDCAFWPADPHPEAAPQRGGRLPPYAGP
jgi:hypothetical protein